jgi:hypothetical protein
MTKLAAVHELGSMSGASDPGKQKTTDRMIMPAWESKEINLLLERRHVL